MQLSSLYIKEYKLLNDFTINFKKDVSILIGVNGSGKSSILECLAQIFSDAYLNEKSKFAFTLKYDLRLEEVIETTSTTSEFKIDLISVEIAASKKGDKLQFKVFIGNDIIEKANEIEQKFGSIESILPSNIVIYYSGLAEIMKKICEPHDEKLSINYRKGNALSKRPFFYFEPPLFNIILIALLSYEYGDIPAFLRDRAKIKGVEFIHIHLKKPTWAKGKINNWWGATGEVKQFLDFLDSIGKPLVIDESTTDNSIGNVVIEGVNNDYLNITILTQQKLFEIKDHFIEERKLFNVLNTIIIDGFQPEIRFSFIQEDERGNDKTFSVLSEGEQQAIIIRGLIELVNNENTLFLFDEPDTYLHPSWQRNFIEGINALANITDYNNSQFVITTHSPQLLSNADPESTDVQIMEDGEIVKITPKYYGREIDTILYEMMGVERRNNKVAKQLSVLFNYIEDEDLENARNEYTKLAELLGDDDPALVRAKTQLDYLVEEQNEADN